MAENSAIQWCHHTFNPWIGCTRISPACDNCYAEAWDRRFGGSHWGARAARRRTRTWSYPVKWNRRAADTGTRLRVFCASLADVFDTHPSIDRNWHEELWQLIEATPSIDWLMLTKRPQNAAKVLPARWLRDGLPAHVWVGVTVETPHAASQRLPALFDIPARLRFLSCEPLLERVDLTCVETRHGRLDALSCGTPWIDWVIAGGESGPGFRSSDPAWFRLLRDQCAAHNAAFFFKQWSGVSQAAVKKRGRMLDGVVHDAIPAIPAHLP